MEIKKATTQYEFFSLMQIRVKVFMCEQNVDPAIEVDDEDKNCDHYIVTAGDTIVATCRVLHHDDVWHLGRIAVLKEYRKKQFGTHLIKHIIALAQRNNVKKLELGAQLHALPFYENLGFCSIGEVFMEANIAHRKMEMCL